MGVRYIGNKTRVAEQILDLAGSPTGRFVDAFSGTGAVAAAAANRGWSVVVNDTLPSAVAMSVSSVLGTGNVAFAHLGGYTTAIRELNNASGIPGFLYSAYSPASVRTGPTERKYFTEHNASRLDAMRQLIATWSNRGHLTWLEEQLLLSDLMQAANTVANISGTYGSFLKDWSSSALRPVTLHQRTLPSRTTNVLASTQDVFDVKTRVTDTVYLDPPYTKRQYSAYYHILETLHAGDAPAITGITGLRPWQDRASIFCYKREALGALTRLVAGLDAKNVFLSYSNEGHVPQDHLVAALSRLGSVSVHALQTIPRYRPNAGASAAGTTVDEYVIQIEPHLQLNSTQPSPRAAVFA
jgi:adenine-specific DNA-methyltransferase